MPKVMNAYPLMDSFEIVVHEDWMDPDLSTSKPIFRVSEVNSLCTVYPAQSESSRRELFSIDLRLLLDHCYGQKLKEKRKKRQYASATDANRTVYFWAVCRIRYAESQAFVATIS